MNQIDSAADNIELLSEQTKKINSVLTVIDDIAEQTNLLALNVAIEAVTAGEQGQGLPWLPIKCVALPVVPNLVRL